MRLIIQKFLLLISAIIMVDGTFFPFIWQPPRPNLITYNFISPHHGQHKRSNSVSTNRYGPRSGQPTVLRVQSPLFGVRLSVPPSRTNSFYNNLPFQLPIDLGYRNAIGSIPFGREGSYGVPFDALLANYLRPPVTASNTQASNFPFRTPLNSASIPTRQTRPEVQPNLFIPPNILIGPQPSPPRTFPPPVRPPNFPNHPNIFFGDQTVPSEGLRPLGNPSNSPNHPNILFGPPPPRGFTPPERSPNFPIHPSILFGQQPPPPRGFIPPERSPNSPNYPNILFGQQLPPPEGLTPPGNPQNFPIHPNILFGQQSLPSEGFTPTSSQPNSPNHPNILFGQQSPPSRGFTPSERSPNFPIQPNNLFGQQSQPPRQFTSFGIPYPFNF